VFGLLEFLDTLAQSQLIQLQVVEPEQLLLLPHQHKQMLHRPLSLQEQSQRQLLHLELWQTQSLV
jgi:hypothetical protein